MLYRVSRFSLLHKMLRNAAYSILWNMPDWVKWPALGALLRFRLPYRLLKPGDTVVQIGAPWDLLKAGRSRGIHFARAVGKSGKAVIIEPDPDNVLALNRFVEKHRLKNVIIIPTGAWSRKTRLRFLVDHANPAANLVEDVVDTSRTDLQRFEVTEIEVNSVENILKENELSTPRLVSITTNGSENEILKGMTTIAGKLEYLATIGDENDIPMLKEFHFVKFGGDDRGWTYRHDVEGS
jgi:FkbM family methyltransferase